MRVSLFVLGLDAVHVFVPLVFDHASDFGEGGQQELGLVCLANGGDAIGDRHEAVGHVGCFVVVLPLAKLRDAFLAPVELLADVVVLPFRRGDDIRRVLLRPSDEDGVGVFQGGAFDGRGNAVLDVHQEHVAHRAQPGRRQPQGRLGVVIHHVAHIADRVCHYFLTCPLP